jgi:putative glutamine amidotransferase
MARRVAITFGNIAKLAPYEDALRAVGIEPVRNPGSLDGLDGLLVTGGTDVDPAVYGQTPQPETQQPDKPRDELERRLIHEALVHDLPTLCICRGMQMFNVVHGGTLIQHLEPAHPHKQDEHNVDIVPETKLAQIVLAPRIPVNSRHHQAVGGLGSGLTISARADDGIIEAIEHPNKRFVIAVQWHPEDRMDAPADRRIFEAFREALR